MNNNINGFPITNNYSQNTSDFRSTSSFEEINFQELLSKEFTEEDFKNISSYGELSLTDFNTSQVIQNEKEKTNVSNNNQSDINLKKQNKKQKRIHTLKKQPSHSISKYTRKREQKSQSTNRKIRKRK